MVSHLSVQLIFPLSSPPGLLNWQRLTILERPKESQPQEAGSGPSWVPGSVALTAALRVQCTGTERGSPRATLLLTVFPWPCPDSGQWPGIPGPLAVGENLCGRQPRPGDLRFSETYMLTNEKIWSLVLERSPSSFQTDNVQMDTGVPCALLPPQPGSGWSPGGPGIWSP